MHVYHNKHAMELKFRIRTWRTNKEIFDNWLFDTVLGTWGNKRKEDYWIISTMSFKHKKK